MMTRMIMRMRRRRVVALGQCHILADRRSVRSNAINLGGAAPSSAPSILYIVTEFTQTTREMGRESWRRGVPWLGEGTVCISLHVKAWGVRGGEEAQGRQRLSFPPQSHFFGSPNPLVQCVDE